MRTDLVEEEGCNDVVADSLPWCGSERSNVSLNVSGPQRAHQVADVER